MHIHDLEKNYGYEKKCGSGRSYCDKTAKEYLQENRGRQGNPFWEQMNRKEGINERYRKEYGGEGEECSEEDWEEKLKKWDEEMKRVRERNRRESKRLQEERLRKRRIQRKLWEKLALKKYLARQDEIMQMNEKISLERAVGEDVYIEEAPLSKSLSVAEIMAICSEL